MTTVPSYQYQSSFARLYVAEGRTRGMVDAILTVLQTREITMTDRALDRICACSDHDKLEKWLKRAAVMSDGDKFFQEQ